MEAGYLEEELENLRFMLYQCIDGLPSRLDKPAALLISKLLDELIIEVQKQKARNIAV